MLNSNNLNALKNLKAYKFLLTTLSYVKGCPFVSTHQRFFKKKLINANVIGNKSGKKALN